MCIQPRAESAHSANMQFSLAHSAESRSLRHKVPYFNVSRQNRVVFNRFALSGSLRLSLALSGSLWLSIALRICLQSPILGSQGPCSARNVIPAFQHFNQPWCWPLFVDISPLSHDVIYRTCLAGPNIPRYIGSTRETRNLIILVHSVATCSLQQTTLHCSAL